MPWLNDIAKKLCGDAGLFQRLLNINFLRSWVSILQNIANDTFHYRLTGRSDHHSVRSQNRSQRSWSSHRWLLYWADISNLNVPAGGCHEQNHPGEDPRLVDIVDNVDLTEGWRSFVICKLLVQEVS